MGRRKNINKEAWLNLRKRGWSIYDASRVFDISERTGERYERDLKANGEISDVDQELIKENVRLSKKAQKYQDKNRIERKSFREHVRLENAVEELQREIITLLKEKTLPKNAFRGKKIRRSKKVGAVLHLADTHFNELINLMFNRYDFEVASKRLRKFVNDAKKYMKANGVKDVCIANTGDTLNSDRRLDELLSQATNRAKAVMLSLTLLEQVILDLQKDFNVSVASVIGNESRITKDVGWVEDVASDNYDFIIHQMLKKIFRNSKVKFIEGHKTEKVIGVAGQNILLVHGNQVKKSNMEEKVQSIKGKWSSNHGVKIDFMIFGHLHSCRIHDAFARSSSLAGPNAYSNDALQLYSRASQNLHIFFSNGNRDSIKIDLQNVDGVEGYPIDKELEAYNAKSLDKAKKKVTVHKVVI